jgi:CHAT domain-containing protein
MFIRSSDLARQKKTETETLLAVGDPRFSHEQFPLLSALPSAGKEAQKIKTNYGRASRILVGANATKRLVEVEMRRANVVHLAMHSVVDEDSPLRSKLIFAADGDGESRRDDGVLYAYEINSSRLPLAHLVILSACETGVGRYYRGEGMMGLSRAFLAAEVPLVIGSLWRVDSDSTTDLMVAFHGYRKNEHLSSAAALQKAQQSIANGPDLRYRHPYYWAAFTLVGGSAAF